MHLGFLHSDLQPIKYNPPALVPMLLPSGKSRGILPNYLGPISRFNSAPEFIEGPRSVTCQSPDHARSAFFCELLNAAFSIKAWADFARCYQLLPGHFHARIPVVARIALDIVIVGRA